MDRLSSCARDGQQDFAFIFIPAIILALINFSSIFINSVFSIDDAHNFHRGPLGFLPFVVAGLYCVFLVYILIKRSNKKSIEIIPIVFLCFALFSGLVLPFVYGKAYAHIIRFSRLGTLSFSTQALLLCLQKLKQMYSARRSIWSSARMRCSMS